MLKEPKKYCLEDLKCIKSKLQPQLFGLADVNQVGTTGAKKDGYAILVGLARDNPETKGKISKILFGIPHEITVGASLRGIGTNYPDV